MNYYGGWGQTFGNVTGGGEFDSKTNCNPTPYVPTYRGDLSEATLCAVTYEQTVARIVWCLPIEWTERKYA